MPKRLALCALLVALLIAWLVSGTGITVPSGRGAPADKPAIVLPANAAYKRWAILVDSPLRSPGVADLLAVQLSAARGIELVEREQIDATLKELGLSQALGDDVRGRLQLGRILRADALMILSSVAAVPSLAPPAADSGNADPDQASSLAAQAAGAVKAVVADCRQGARLRQEYLAYRPQDVPDLARQAAQVVATVCNQYPEGLRQVIGLAPFVCRNLDHDYDQYQSGFAHLLAEALATPGMAVIETQEAQAIRRERDLSGADRIERLVPLFVEGEYEVRTGNGTTEPQVRLSIQLTRSDAPLETVRGEDVPLGQVGRFLAEQSAPVVRRAVGAREIAPLSDDAQVARLAAKAADFDSLGMWTLAAELREALLLIQPGDLKQRAMLLEDYGRGLPNDASPALGGTRLQRIPPTEDQLRVFDAWCRRRAGLFHCCLNHLEYLIRHAGVTRQAAVELAEGVFRAAPTVPHGLAGLAGRVAPIAQPLEEQKKRFLGTVYRRILDLPLPTGNARGLGAADQTFQAWQHTLTRWCFVRLDGRTLGPEDLDFARQVLTETLAGHRQPAQPVLFFLQHQASPCQIDPTGQATYVLSSDSRYRFSDEQCVGFLRQLAASKEPLTSIYGRYGLLRRQYDHGGIRATQEMLAECEAILSLYAKSQAALGGGVPQSDDLRLALAELQDGIQQRLAGAPPGSPAKRDLAAGEPYATGSTEVTLSGRTTRPPATQPGPRVTCQPLSLRLRNAPGRSAPLEGDQALLRGQQGYWMQVRPCGDQLDAWWTGGLVALMHEPGWLDVIFTVEGRRRVEDVCWDGQAAWIAVSDGRCWRVEPDGCAVPAGDNEPTARPLAVALHAIEPGRVICVSVYDADPRITCALLEWKAGQAAQRRIHTVEGGPRTRAVPIRNSWYGGRRLGRSLLWMIEPDQDHRTLLVGLRGRLKEAIPGFPLAIDLETLEVTPQAVREDGSQDILLAAGDCLWGNEDESFWCAPRAADEGGQRRWQAVLPLPQTYRGGGRGPYLFALNGAIYAPGETWYRLYPDLNVGRVLGPPSPPDDVAAQDSSPTWNVLYDYGQSAHHGLVMWDQKLSAYRVTIDDPPLPARDARPAASEPSGLAFAVLAESRYLDETLAQGLREALPAGSPDPIRLATVQETFHNLVQPQGRAQRQRLGRAFGLDYLLIEHRQDSSISLVSVTDARTGMQLFAESLPRQQRQVNQNDPLISAKVRDMIQRLGTKPPRPVAVARLQSTDPNADPYGEALTHVLRKALATHEQIVVTAAEEIASSMSRPVEGDAPTGTLLRGRYGLLPAEGKAEPRLSIRLEVLDDAGGRQTVEVEDIPSAAIAQLHEQLHSRLGIPPGGDASQVVDRACRNLLAQADELARSGQTTRACDLLQACLLLNPAACEPRLALLRRQFTLLYRPPADEARCTMDAASYGVWLRQRADSWRRLVHQVQELVSGGGITQAAAGEVAREALALPAHAGWGRDMPELEADRRRFLREISRQIRQLPLGSRDSDAQAGGPPAWQEGLLTQAANRLDGRYGREDLELLRDLLADAPAGLLPAALLERLVQRDPWPGAEDDAQKGFLDQLIRSPNATLALLGRFGALCRAYHHSQVEAATLAEADALLEAGEATRRQFPGTDTGRSLHAALRSLRPRLVTAQRGSCTQPSSPLPLQDPNSTAVLRLVPIDLNVRLHPDRQLAMSLKDDVPYEEQLRRHRANRTVRLSSIASLNRQSDYSRGESWHWTRGGTIDVLWSDKSVVSMPPSGEAAEIVAGDDLAIHNVHCDGQRIWVADIKQGITIVTPAGEPLARIGRAEGLPPADQALLLHLLGEGKALACGSLGTEQRAWIAVIDMAGPRVHVIHQATRVLARSVTDGASPASRQAAAGRQDQPQADAACLPRWILPIGPQSLLIGRGPSRYAGSSNWLPLRVDLADERVSVFDPQCLCPSGNSVSYFPCLEGLYASDGDHLWQWAGPDRAWDDGLPWRQLAQRDWRVSGPDESLVTAMGRVAALPVGERLCLPGWQILQRDAENRLNPIASLWKEYDPSSGASRPLPPEIVPVYPIVPEGYAVSARWGPVMWGWSRAPQMGESPLAAMREAAESPRSAPPDRAEEWRRTVRIGRLILFRIEVVKRSEP